MNTFLRSAMSGSLCAKLFADVGVFAIAERLTSKAIRKPTVRELRGPSALSA